MKSIIISLFVLLLVTVNKVEAQDEHDALRYGFTTYQGTARSMGIGGALGSMGGDFTSLSVNPAGVGIYSRSEFMLSPSFYATGNEGTYLGSNANANASKFNFTNFGMVVSNQQTKRRSKKNGWKFVNFAIGMNRLASFKNETTYTGKNNSSSLIESFADDFNSLGGINQESLNGVNFSAYGAYQTYLIDRGQGADSNKAVSYVPYSDGLNQTKRVYESGRITEYLFNVGGNYMDKLMIGATVGITSVLYERTLRFDEVDASGNLNNDFRYFNYSEFLKTSGTGFNLKLGAIYKPSQRFRMGLALHTPTHIELNDISSISIVSHTDSLLLDGNPSANPVTTYTQDSALIFNYSQTTPYKALASAIYFFGKSGFITADMEYVNYASMKYNYGIGYEKESEAINQVIDNTYSDALNVRLGAEAKLNSVSFRAGFAYYGSPYRSASNRGELVNLSAGVGYRQEKWFLDAAYIQSMSTREEVPYIIARANANIQQASIQQNRGIVALTFGLKF